MSLPHRVTPTLITRDATVHVNERSRAAVRSLWSQSKRERDPTAFTHIHTPIHVHTYTRIHTFT